MVRSRGFPFTRIQPKAAFPYFGLTSWPLPPFSPASSMTVRHFSNSALTKACPSADDGAARLHADLGQRLDQFGTLQNILQTGVELLDHLGGMPDGPNTPSHRSTTKPF